MMINGTVPVRSVSDPDPDTIGSADPDQGRSKLAQKKLKNEESAHFLVEFLRIHL
jgi:hypothetical protein